MHIKSKGKSNPQLWVPHSSISEKRSKDENIQGVSEILRPPQIKQNLADMYPFYKWTKNSMVARG